MMETNTVKFSIEDYLKLVITDQTHEVTLEDMIVAGTTFELITLASDNVKYPIIGTYGFPGGGDVLVFNNEGISAHKRFKMILKRKVPKVVALVSFTRQGNGGAIKPYVYLSESDSKASEMTIRFSVVEITDEMIEAGKKNVNQ